MSIRLTASTLDDIDQIKEWQRVDLDEDHRTIDPTWWLTGNDSYLSFCIQDDEGPVCWVRLDKENEHARLGTQFAPPEIVSKPRLVAGMLAAFKVCVPHLVEEGFHGIITMTRFPHLANFLVSQVKFERVGQTDEYLLKFATSAELAK
jgi:hypothetical protein